jgi:hypothetical protein
MKNDIGIIRLEEISPNTWRAKYRGNYGVYTIKITTDGKKTIKFSCSCPSDYYPCKHIAMVKDAIDGRKAQNKNIAEKEITYDKNSVVAKLLRDVSRADLYKFIVRQACYSKKLTNAILVEFVGNVTEKNKNDTTNPYSVVLRETLRNTKVKKEDYYHRDEYEGGIENEALDQILVKLKEYFNQKNYREVVFICKACIEELSEWLVKKSRKFSAIGEFIHYEYLNVPFKMLGEVVENSDKSGIDLKELYEYCRSEIRNSKYYKMGMSVKFNDFFLKVSLKVNPDGFIELQDELFAKVQNKNSLEAAIILQRKINLYNLNNQPKKAWEIIESNIQIESFRKELVKKKIKEQKFTEAKKLINDYLNDDKNDSWARFEWDKLLLEIAQKQNDKQVIREISFRFIDKKFNAEYLKIYKSTFNNEEWKEIFEQLLISYDKASKQGLVYFNQLDNTSVFDFLVAENEIDRLLEFVEKYLTVHLIGRYHKNLADKFPAKTLFLFRKALDSYAKNTLGRDAYEYLAEMLKKMQQINGGNEIVKDMVKQYRFLYKNRRAMREVLSKFL